MGTLEYCWPSSGARRLPVEHYFGIRKMKVTLFFLAALAITINGKPAPNAEPKAFFGTGLGAIALPAITNSALIDGLLLGKVAFLKAAILANLLLGSSDESADDAEYGAPAVDSYGAPAQEYAEPAPSYDAPAPTYEEPAATYEEPAVDTYGAPAADPLPSYGATNYYRFYVTRFVGPRDFGLGVAQLSVGCQQ